MSSVTTLDTASPLGLTRLRRDKDTQSTSSLVSSSSAGNDSGEGSNGTGGGLKASLSNAVGRMRKSVDGRRESVVDDDGSVSPQRRLSTIFKRNKKRGDDADAAAAAGRRRSSQQTLDPSSQHTGDDRSLTVGSRRSSLLTDDGDESNHLSPRPGLSAHNSHQGFLTLSSPAVNAKEEADDTAQDNSPPSPIKSILVPSIIEPSEIDLPLSAEQTTEPLTLQPQSLAGRITSTTSLPQTVHEPPSQRELGDIKEREGRPHSTSEPPAPSQDINTTATSPTRLRIVPVETDAAPETLVTPPTPVSASNSRSVSPTKNSDGSVRRRRALSGGQPSKLSKSTLAPLTPTVEEAKTPGGTIVQPGNSTGFFASVFSVAQKAADQITTTVGVTGSPKSRDNSRPTTAISHANTSQQEASASTASLATSSTMGSTTDLHQSQVSAVSEKEAAARAVSNAYEKPLLGLQRTNGRPVSVASNDRLTLNGDQTPPRQAEDGDALKRTGSVRSRFSARRHRGSSAATGSGIGAALRESAAGLSHVSTNAPGHRMTGFAVASKKRNKDFHQQFRSVPEDDYLIEDYSAALQRDILLHGRLYVSEGHICFSSNILGWVTNLVMSFDEIVSVEKKSTAVIFPNAIVIQTVSARNTFASFVARDSTYELIIGIWKINHPNLKSSLNGVALQNAGTGDKTEKADSIGSDESDTESDEFYDEDAEDDGKASYYEGSTTRSVAGSDVGESAPLAKAPTKSATGPAAGSDSKQGGQDTKAKEITENPAANSTSTGGDSLGPDTHPPTDCGDADQHYDRALIDANIAAPLGKIYSLMWGPGSGAFMSKWLVDDQKSRELDLKDDKTGLDKDHKTMTFSYIKPLGGSVGPKQTKCITTNTLEQFNLEKAVIVSCSTQTPDVPSGNVFLTKTRYCLTWAPNNSTRLVANCTIEWSGKSWLKGPIEKGAQDGQTQYAKDIVAALKAATASKSPAKAGAKKGRKRSKKDEDEEDAKDEQKPSTVVDTKPNWGLLEPLHPILEPVLDLVRPFVSPQVTIAVLFVLLVYTWVSPPARAGTGVGVYRHSPASHLAVYESLWQKEEAELWDWLEDRVGLSEIHAAKIDDRKQRQKASASKKMGKQIADEKMNQRQLDEAIQITQERLEALKDAVGRQKASATASSAREEAGVKPEA